MADIIHLQEIWDELARIAEMQKAALGLKGIYQGDYAFQPTAGIGDMVNGLWIHPTPEMTSEAAGMPRGLIQRYQFRFVYVRRISLNENPTKRIVADVKTLVNAFADKFDLPDITGLPSHAQVLSCNVASINFQPQEDDFTAGVAADLKAVAFQMDVQVRTRR